MKVKCQIGRVPYFCSWYTSCSLIYFCPSRHILPLFENSPPSRSCRHTYVHLLSSPCKESQGHHLLQGKMFVCVHVCIFSVLTCDVGFFCTTSEVLVCEPFSLHPRAFVPSQGKSPHAKEKKWGVKGTVFPLDLLLYAPSVPSLCHSEEGLRRQALLMCPFSCSLHILWVKQKSDMAL